MKKLFTSITICVVMSLILSSCGSSSFITKRRYTKGYYVSHTHGKQKTPARPSFTDKADAGTAVTVVTETQADTEMTQPAKTEKAEKTAPAAKKTNFGSRKNKIAAARAIRQQAGEATELSLGEVKSSHRNLPSLRPYADSDDDALSLFWIVIIVILVLYLLGVISGGWGLGFLIHLLLIIALILLILWLLRIV